MGCVTQKPTASTIFLGNMTWIKTSMNQYMYIYIIYTAFWDERKGAVPEFWSIAIVIFFQGMNQIDSIPFDQLMSGIFFVDEL